MAHQVRSLEQAGVMVHVACTRAASGKPTYFRSRHQVTDLIREFQPNLVHVHFGYTALAVLPCPLPKVLTLCGDDISGTADGVGHITLKSRLGATVTRRVARSFDAVVVMNPTMRAKLAPETVDRTVILPYGIDTTRFMPGSRSEAREKLGLTPDGLVVTFVNSGRQRTKRLDLARAAVDRLKADGHSVTLLVAEDVHPDDMPAHYRAANCLLMTSDVEGSPNCVKEALACGTPVVSVPVGDVPEVIAEADGGCVADRDPQALAAAVLQVTAASRPQGASLLPQRFTLGGVTKELLQLYSSLLSGQWNVIGRGPSGHRDLHGS